MVDTLYGGRRQADLDLHPARRPGVARRQARHAEDCVASLKRWGGATRMGQKLMDFIDDIEAVDAKTFTMKLKRALRPGARLARQAVVERAVHDAQARRRDAADRKLIEADRLGPVHLRQGRVKPGEKDVYTRTRVQAARGAPSGLAGGKVVKVDRVEWIEMPDPQTAGERADRRRDRRHRAAAARSDPERREGHAASSSSTGTRSASRSSSASTGSTRRSTTRRSARPRCWRLDQEDYLKAQIGDRVLQGPATPRSSAARRTPSMPAPAPSPTSRRPRSC